MLKRDILGIYLPTAYVMLGLSNLIVCQCVANPDTSGITGPSGSTMICFFYYLFHLLLWIPLGIVLVLFQWLRYRGPVVIKPRAADLVCSGDITRHAIGGLFGGLFVLASFLVIGDPYGFFSVFLASSIVSFLAAFAFFGFGALITLSRRHEIKDAELGQIDS